MPLFPLEVKADRSDLLGLEGRLGTDEAPLVPGHDGPRMWQRNTRRIAFHSMPPEPRDCGSGKETAVRLDGRERTDRS
jgi:hypothetical protein